MSKTPATRKYADGRLWYERGGKFVTLGITADAAEEIGSVTEIEFPELEDGFDEGDLVVTVAGIRGVVEVTAPAAGTVEEVNEVLHGSTEILTKDPEDEGWVIRLKLEDPDALDAAAEEEEIDEVEDDGDLLEEEELEDEDE